MIYENENFIVKHSAYAQLFSVEDRHSGDTVEIFSYTLLGFPYIFLAKRAKKKAIKFADDLNKVCTP